MMKDSILIGGEERYVQDLMNPPGMFVDGKRRREHSAASDHLPLSGKLIPEFFGRRNIRDMFVRKPSLQQSQSTDPSGKEAEDLATKAAAKESPENDTSILVSVTTQDSPAAMPLISSNAPTAVGKKRPVAEAPISNLSKRSKSGSVGLTSPAAGKGQQSLKGFFKAKTAPSVATQVRGASQEDDKAGVPNLHTTAKSLEDEQFLIDHDAVASLPSSTTSTPCIVTTPARVNGLHSNNNLPVPARNIDSVHDPIESKESWSKLFTKPIAPRCEGHDEPCITLLTKKPGMNLGRSFWMCPRPLGPTGAKEKNTQWRCQTFIWCSDWNPNSASG